MDNNLTLVATKRKQIAIDDGHGRAGIEGLHMTAQDHKGEG